MTQRLEKLAAVLPRIRDGSASRSEIRLLFEELYSMAVSYLQMKVKASSIDSTLIRGPIESVAIDTLRNLMERDDSRRFTRLSDYLANRDIPSPTPERIMIEIRRIVCSETCLHLLRSAVEREEDFAETMRQFAVRCAKRHAIRGDYEFPWIHFDDAATHLKRPIMPIEVLGAHFGEIGSLRRTEDIVQSAGAVLGGSDVYSRSYPVAGLALFVEAW